jgi:hypothetical protein
MPDPNQEVDGHGEEKDNQVSEEGLEDGTQASGPQGGWCR